MQRIDRVMRKITVDLGHRSYPVYIGKNILDSRDLFASVIQSQQVLIITNSTLAPIYLGRLEKTLADFRPHSFIIEDGESYKNLQVVNDIITELLTLKFSRNCNLVALGGGVVGDITGFSAACYQRGINYVQVPTTLLAQVDSAVGGKTAVNHELGKNMIGAFHQPAAVFSDSQVLTTLPHRELVAGLAEVIKYGMIRDVSFFKWLEDNIHLLLQRDHDALQYAIEHSCRNKAEIVGLDEKENGVRALLNFGHTFGHAVETGLNYRHWLHGEAVGLGMLMAAYLSFRCRWLAEDSLQRIRMLLQKTGLPLSLPPGIDAENVRELMSVDKKARDGQLHLVLLRDIGKAEVTNRYDETLLEETLQYFQAKTGAG